MLHATPDSLTTSVTEPPLKRRACLQLLEYFFGGFQIQGVIVLRIFIMKCTPSPVCGSPELIG